MTQPLDITARLEWMASFLAENGYPECGSDCAEAAEEIKRLRWSSDTARLNHLEALMKACPDFTLRRDDIEDSDGFFLETRGCETVTHTADSLRELLDQSIHFEASGEDFEVWRADYHGDPRTPEFGVVNAETEL